ncbi:MAG TPA: hypothetical protein DCE44_09330 [Verrucomicrobiales bacterium]|nr:hypothetical protein [Verrucomicrobiales bacterium]
MLRRLSVLWLLGLFVVHAELPESGLFARTNLVAWCIVPFDSQKRGPEERAAMLDRLGIHRLAYDWRAEHIPTFDAEVAALRKHGIELTAWWFPAGLNEEAKAILACLERNHLHPQLWVTMGTEPEADPTKLAEKIQGAVATLTPLCEAAKKLGSSVALYNHLGWFGEPTNQVAIIERLRSVGVTNVGCVYNFHHAHAHIDDFTAQLRVLQPYLVAINLNGMVREGDRTGKKIIPLGTGDQELAMLRALKTSGWNGPVGIIGHTDEDAEVKLRQELDGLTRLAPLANQPAQSPLAPASSTAREGLSRPSPANPSAGSPKISGQEPGTQAEKDWEDNRWQETDVGPFLASNLRLPDGSTLAKGLSIKLGRNQRAAVAYDTAQGTVRAFWTGDFLKFDPARFGLISPPKPGGPIEFTAIDAISKEPLKTSNYQFRGIHRTASGTVLDYRLGDADVLEAPALEETPAGPVLVRRLWIGPHAEPLTFIATGHLKGTNSQTLSAQHEGVDASTGVVLQQESRRISSNSEGTVASALGVSGQPVRSSQSLNSDRGGIEVITLEPSKEPQRLDLRCWRGPTNALAQFNTLCQTVGLGANPKDLLKNPSAQWQTLTTRGQRGADTDFLAVDTLTMPYDNPWKALLFGSGVDLTPDGAAYVCTIHGDVWRVTGIDDSLQELKWQRFATGLFQPLGLKVRDGQVYVLGRDRITRLRDLNNDGEADFYESFFEGIDTSTGGHDYVTCLEKDDAENFYYVDPKGVHRVSADGRSKETLATGFRNPNGMGVRPDGKVITVAPQQGDWTPSSFIAEIRPSGYYGYGGPRVTPDRPNGYDAPLLWIPHSVDNSSGSQVWVPSGKWGPLSGQMLHLLWGRCGLMLVLRDASGTDSAALQGAVVPLPAKFLSGPNRGSFNPRDGSMYVAGSTGWQTSAVKDGCLQRVRFTGKPVGAPVGFRLREKGLELAFARPLDPATANDPGSYDLKAWNYKYAQQYGSKDWSVSKPNQEGRDRLPVASAKLQPDGRTVLLEVPDLGPVMQVELKYNVEAADGGQPIRGTLWYTVNRAIR